MLRRLSFLALGALALWLSAGLAPGSQQPVRAAQQYRIALPGVASDSTSGATFDLGKTASGARYCRFLPGVSVAAPMPPEVTSPPPPEPGTPQPLPNLTPVPPSDTQRHLGIFNQLMQAINDNYVDPLFNGNDLDELRAAYLPLVQGGLTDSDFYRLMEILVTDLDDDHSRFQTPAEVQAETRRLAEGQNYVGIGVYLSPLRGTAFGSIIVVFPGSPAELAGLRPHDMIVAADGKPPLEADGTNNIRGLPGTVAFLRIRRQGVSDFTVSIPRATITGSTPIDSCLIAGTRIGYILIPTFFDNGIGTKVRAAVQQLTADGPLSGLILDNRMNSGGLSSTALQVLGLFTGGVQGELVLRSSSEAFEVIAEDVGGSQKVPLVVLVGPNTVSFGEIFAGVLQHSGRASVVGDTTFGNVELLRSFPFADGSRAWLANLTFQPNGLPAGIWEETGIVPDYPAPSRWDLFTEFNDPALVRAVQVLGAK